MRNFITHEWFTVCTIFGVLALTAAKYLNTIRFSDFISIIGNSKYLNIYSKNQKFIDPFDGLLFINLALSASIFLHFSYSTFIDPLTFELVSFLKLILAVSAIVIIKTLLERLIGSLFEIDSIIDSYLFQKITFLNYSGLVLIITNPLILYTKIDTKIIIIIAFILICLINCIGFITSFKNHQKAINPNFFYFLLYLCALEIAPYILLYKVISEYNV
ncbi:DUF4271 domain-containing protein [Winogradskyella sp.]|jgi:hypothetical protein|uniref:DUF4271 domain-containing protein n=1 Tax=Winogradskyella sp. TaxID=1883156 RepID=UPI0025F5DABE|nr:DUF4271 domain-containing protein [Winogradskyella sp.]MCT4630623.1 DUF4271 domain-containing protein [Winogradskyella sp.]